MEIKININDKLVNFIKRVVKKESIIAGIFFSVIAASIFVYAAPVTVPNTFVEGDLISASQVNANFQALQQKINELDTTVQSVQQSVQTVQQSVPASVPVGTIMPYAGNADSVPAGWMLCDGSEISRTEYAGLYAVIGISWGAGDMADTYNLPDMRGRFLRGVDRGAGNDPDAGTRTRLFNGGNTGDAVGTYQNDEFYKHSHGVTLPSFVQGYYVGSTWYWGTDAPGPKTTDETGGNETRPKNAAVNYIIKY